MESLPLLCWHQSRLPFALSVFFFFHFVKAASSRVNPSEQEKMLRNFNWFALFVPRC